MSARRVLAVLECHSCDAAVLRRAVAVVEESGGCLTLVAVVPGRVFNPGPYCVPQPSPEERRAQAAAVLRRFAALVPEGIPLLTAVDEGSVGDVIARRVEAAAHDLVVVRRSRLRFRPWPRSQLAPMLAVTG